MTRTRRWFCGTLAAVMAMVPSSTASSAVTQRECRMCWSDINGTSHSFVGTMWPGCTGGADCYDCNSFNTCHTNTQVGACNEFHNQCGGDALAAAEHDLRSTDTAVVLSALRAVARAGGDLEYDATREMLVGYGCDGGAMFMITVDPGISAVID